MLSGMLSSALVALPLLGSLASAFTPVTGVQDGQIGVRTEVHQMLANPDKWNLYLLGLQRFQSQDQSQLLSYYSIAGLHGVPNVPFDGVQQAANGVGYCPHGNMIFLAWHRAFLALFEQAMYTNVQAVVNSFPAGAARNRYAAAANGWRIPYWDWAAAPPSGLPSFPYVFSEKYVDVVTPTGNQTILNPLFRYDFHPLDRAGFLDSPWNQWPVTLRYPTSPTDPTASSQNNLVQNTFQTQRVGLRDTVYNAFTMCPSFPEFNTDSVATSSPNCHGSIESVHNSIHNFIGGMNNGHMTYLWWSAFDPLFWLHHANVERYFAMYQVLFPDTYLVPQSSPGSTFVIAKGSQVGPNTYLEPFHRDTAGNFWTPIAIRNLNVFGYTYPEVQSANGNAAAMRASVNSLYGPNSASNSKRDIIGDITSNVVGQQYEYIANIACQRFGLGTSYSVFVFVGQPSNDSTMWESQTELAGIQGILATPGVVNNNNLITGAVPLTRKLSESLVGGVLADLAVPVVVPFLQTELQWRVAMANGTVVPNDMVPGLNVSVVATKVLQAGGADNFPVFSEFTTLANTTHGKSGGFGLQAKAPVACTES